MKVDQETEYCDYKMNDAKIVEASYINTPTILVLHNIIKVSVVNVSHHNA